MCGIAGILVSDSLRGDLSEQLSRMQAALRHRGPDDAGVFVSPLSTSDIQPRCGLVHTRLAILDLSSAGHQPMSSVDDRFTITFNGEIYNFLELRAQLVSAGVQFRSHSDTEVILQLYARHGADCVKQLRGMFAFAIWDALEQTCFLARDPLGIKPLYYHLDEASGSLVFASEIRALLASGRVPRRLDSLGAYGFFCKGSVPEPFTMIRGVRCLPAGHLMFWREGRIGLQRYWQLSFDPVPIEPADAVRVTRDALLDSVRHHFVSDVPVGVFLSGGIDSTALVALAAVTGQKQIRTYSIGFADPRFDEGDLALQTARAFGTQHTELQLDSVQGKALFHQFITHLDQPTIDGLNTFSVSRFARDQGAKVVSLGLGGDELFAGYPSFRDVPSMVRWSRLQTPIAPMRRLLGRVLESASPRPSLRRFGEFLQREPTALAAYQSYRGIYTVKEALFLLARYADLDAASEVFLSPPTAPPASTSPADENLADEVSALELSRYMRNQLLRDSDVMSMACGLELRVPLVDRSLVETLARIPASLRLRQGKRLLAEAVPELPLWVTRKAKRGFAFPFEQWMADDWKPMFEQTVRNAGVRAQSWYQKWSLFVFENWCARNEISFSSAD